ncbi:MAG TPA: serine hydrolase domain-containing protein, partial [Actinomycetota bacterium]|nr:serine hydrolase domain-containing protein [Actinomycetota bacterium]
MADRLDLDELRELVAKELERWRAPGLELAVVLDGEVVTAEGFGLRDLAAGLPVTPHTLFHHGSTGKAFTSFLVGTLVDEGLLGWDRPVREYIPDLAFGDEAIGSRVTVRDLLSHRSGLPRHEWVWLANPGWPRSELVRRLRHLEMSRDLRQSFQYSNLGYVAAGYLAGQVAGSDWETSMDERVFAPLGMSRTLTSVERARSSDDFARPYALVDGEVRALPYRPSDPIAPAGQVLSCAQDMARWLLCHTTDGSGAISPGALREMHTVQMGTGPALDNPSMPHIRFHGYGLGWVVGTYRGQDWVFHNGAMDGFRTEMAVLPSVRAGVVVCANFTHTSGLPFALLQHVMDRILALEPGPWLDEAFERDARMREAEQGT